MSSGGALRPVAGTARCVRKSGIRWSGFARIRTDFTDFTSLPMDFRSDFTDFIIPRCLPKKHPQPRREASKISFPAAGPKQQSRVRVGARAKAGVKDQRSDGLGLWVPSVVLDARDGSREERNWIRTVRRGSKIQCNSVARFACERARSHITP